VDHVLNLLGRDVSWAMFLVMSAHFANDME
jgi:hypothetical protein